MLDLRYPVVDRMMLAIRAMIDAVHQLKGTAPECRQDLPAYLARQGTVRVSVPPGVLVDLATLVGGPDSLDVIIGGAYIRKMVAPSVLDVKHPMSWPRDLKPARVWVFGTPPDFMPQNFLYERFGWSADQIFILVEECA